MTTASFRGRLSGYNHLSSVIGFPLFAAAFDSAGRDYVSPLTGPFFLGNAVIWYFLPHLFFIAWAYLGAKQSKKA
jgi:hypothetical protein